MSTPREDQINKAVVAYQDAKQDLLRLDKQRATVQAEHQTATIKLDDAQKALMAVLDSAPAVPVTAASR
jgi:hypothetical protein